MAYKVGIDIGGTFTDLYAYDTQTGKSLCLSSSSTPENYANGVLNVIEKSKIRPEDIELIVHGTTVATNAVIMKTYEKTAFVTTKGMRDLIEIGRFHRKVLYDPYQQKPEPIVSRDNRFTVEERIDKDGNVLEALNENDVRQVAAKIREKGITSVCVGFMNSYVNGKHEKRAAEILKEELSDAYVIASSQILPNIGALGRFTTGIINAALYHLVSNYIENLEDRLRGKGFKGKLLLVQSNGGAITAELVRTKPETLLMSGPAGGVVGALSIGKASGQEDIITFDMGGTSTDISIIEKSKPFMSSDFEIDWDMPVPIPLIEIISIGAGGGSIAWVDSGGVLKVGPRSAGAYPGPVCYGVGGTEPTVCDANLVLGYLDADEFLDGDMKLDVEGAKESIRKLGEKLGLSMIDTAKGILEIVNENMANAVKEVTIGKGRDPRDFALSAFGGAGSLHAVACADKVGVPVVLVPPEPGNLCAFGDINMNLQNEVESFYFSKLDDLDLKDINKRFSNMDKEGIGLLHSQKVPTNGETIKHVISMRYTGQSYELEIECDDLVIKEDTVKTLAEDFHATHKKIYFVNDPDSEVEITKLRTTVIGEIAEEINIQDQTGEKKEAKSKTVKAYFDGKEMDTPVYQRSLITTEDIVSGPAIVREKKSSTIIPPGKKCRIDPNNRSLIIENL